MLFVNIGKDSLNELVEDYFEIDDGNEATIINQIELFPQVLCILLNKNKNGVKITQSLKIPNFLDLSKFSSDNYSGTPYYELKSICYHIGNRTDQGHWLTIKKVFGDWVLCDNHKVVLLDMPHSNKRKFGKH